MKKAMLSILALIAMYNSFAVAPITGPLLVCKRDTVALADATPGGSWSSSDMTVATVDPLTGVVYGAGVGNATITYTVGSAFSVANVTVNPMATIVGLTDLCSGASTIYADATTGGVWSVSPTTVGSIDPSTGAYLALAGGDDTIFYTLSPGCYMSLPKDVRQSPTISGPTHVAPTFTITLTGTPPSGLWLTSSSNITLGSLTGVVTGVSVGTAIVTYISSACTDTAIVNVGALTLGTAGVQEETNDAFIYPNPASNELTIQTPDGAYNTGTISNSIRQEVLQINIAAAITKTDIHNLPPGMYFVLLKGASHSSIQRFVKTE